jgi:tetratricopeptide (TPR) repeat protein
MSNFSDSIKYGLKAIELNPSLIETYIHVALSQNSMGDCDQALHTLSKALIIDSNNDNILNTFELLLSNAKFTKYDFLLDKTIDKLFEKKVLSSNSIDALLYRIEYHPNISKLSNNLNSEEICEDLLGTIQKLKNVPNFFRILTEIIVKNKKIEFVLTTIRKKILFSLDKFQDNQIVIAFQSLITFQSFNNEYIYFQTNKETDITNKIENELKIKA